MKRVLTRIFVNVIHPYKIMVNEINDLLDSRHSVLPACLFHKYCEKWIALAKYSSSFFEKDSEAKEVFEKLNEITDIPHRDILLLKMTLTNMRMKDCKITACNTFCEKCVLRSFSDEQCHQFFQDIYQDISKI